MWCALAVGLLGILYCLSPGLVYQTEFSPDLLLFRGNNYFCLENLHYRRVEWSSPFLDFMRTYDAGAKVAHVPRWDFVHGERKGVKGWMGIARPIYEDFTDTFWIEWSNSNPKGATRLWPQVIAMLRTQRYREVAELLSEVRHGLQKYDDKASRP